MSGAADDDAFHIVIHHPALIDEELSAGLFAGEHEHRHGELGLAEPGKIVGILRKRLEHLEAGLHSAALRISLGIDTTIALRHRFRAIRREVVPEVLEIDPLAARDELERRLAIEMEMPEIAQQPHL